MSISLPHSQTYPELPETIQNKMGRLSNVKPAILQDFAALHNTTKEPAVLDSKTPELIAMAVSVYERYDGCVAFHTDDALKAGASKEEITAALGVAILIGGVPCMMYATQVMDALDQFKQS